MIPKIIHYCWFGRGPMPELAQKCIESWHKFMPDWEYKLWNEDNFDVNSTQYTKEAYEAKKYAFVSDYVRLKALYEEGGLYLDTDVEIIKSLDDFMSFNAFIGYQASKNIEFNTGLIASKPNGIWISEQFRYYDGKSFLNGDGSYNMTPNTSTMTKIMNENGFILNGGHAVYKDELHVFPVDYFCPLTSTRVLKITDNTVCIHHFSGSWIELTRSQKAKMFICEKVIGRKLTNVLIQIKRKIFN